MKTIKVVCGIIRNGDKIFIARRRKEKSLGGFWEFPGGKLEDGEDPKDALERELQEELSMEVVVEDYFMTNIHKYSTFTIELIAYHCNFISAAGSSTDHDKSEWIIPSKLSEFNLAPADISIALKFIEVSWGR
ncbi:MAG: 8-oxo-dGTP diphosphatase MutT [Marinilabiliales bacterium]|nr:MAG: 8-oxo-dGTP diphosphatase MutT [Marinilabiliales bacterium]